MPTRDHVRRRRLADAADERPTRRLVINGRSTVLRADDADSLEVLALKVRRLANAGRVYGQRRVTRIALP